VHSNEKDPGVKPKAKIDAISHASEDYEAIRGQILLMDPLVLYHQSVKPV